MIRINLLPEEYRPSERTSPKLFAAVLMSVICVCGTFGWFGYVYLGELQQREAERIQLEEQLASKRESVQYHQGLTAERTDFQQRAKTLQEISESRVVWTRVLDELVDVVNNDGDVDRHRAWFDRLNVKDGRDAKVGPSLTMPGSVQGDSLDAVADFNEDVENASFYSFVASKGLPSARRNEDETRRPAESLSFQLELSFQPPKEWGAAPAK
jgi:Tfp pilus assembly protein PilN